jgi:hypothetical protein
MDLIFFDETLTGEVLEDDDFERISEEDDEIDSEDRCRSKKIDCR